MYFSFDRFFGTWRHQVEANFVVECVKAPLKKYEEWHTTKSQIE